jgi:hypothetical protein
VVVAGVGVSVVVVGTICTVDSVIIDVTVLVGRGATVCLVKVEIGVVVVVACTFEQRVVVSGVGVDGNVVVTVTVL